MKIKKILIIHPNWRGDVLFSTALIRALKNRFPRASVCSLIVPRCKEILEGNPDIDEIVFQPETKGLKNFLKGLGLVSLLRKKNFDIAFLLTPSWTRSLFLFLAGIPLRVGYKKGRKSIFLNKKISSPKEDIYPVKSAKGGISPSAKLFNGVNPVKSLPRRGAAKPLFNRVHRAEHFLNLAYFLGIKKEKNYHFFIPQQDERWAEDFLNKNKIDKKDFLVILNPGGNWELKRWPPENFALLGDKLIQNYKARIIISGSEKDKKLAEQISDLMQSEPILAAGKTTLKQLGALFKKANLVIANDSGPMHIAVALGCKVIALFGPTSPKITGPYSQRKNWRVIQKDVGCPLPCYNLNCSQNRCMQAISVDEVLAEIAKRGL